MKEIKLTQNKVAIVDDEDYEYLNQYNWFANKIRDKYYARNRHLGLIMHRIIMDAPKDMMVDHINGNGLDNRRSNLRLCTNRQNLQNIKYNKQKSKYPGVGWDKRDKIWRADIRIDGKHKYLGKFEKERDAAKAYERACREIVGMELICKT